MDSCTAVLSSIRAYPTQIEGPYHELRLISLIAVFRIVAGSWPRWPHVTNCGYDPSGSSGALSFIGTALGTNRHPRGSATSGLADG